MCDNDVIHSWEIRIRSQDLNRFNDFTRNNDMDHRIFGPVIQKGMFWYIAKLSKEEVTLMKLSTEIETLHQIDQKLLDK